MTQAICTRKKDELNKYADLVLAADELECFSFFENKTFEIVKRNDVPKERRVLTSRRLVKWKQFPNKVKSRYVIRGFQDDRTLLAVDSPTLRNESFRFLLQKCADEPGWISCKIDCKAAFLQGKEYTTENELVYFDPPPQFRKYFGIASSEVCVALKTLGWSGDITD